MCEGSRQKIQACDQRGKFPVLSAAVLLVSGSKRSWRISLFQHRKTARQAQATPRPDVTVTRRDPNGNVYGASEAISREQALRLYTSAAARYTFEEGQKGTLEPGKLADLVVLSADYMTVPEDQIKDIKADVTMVGGKVVFQR
jgi:hypothetical protein